MHRAPYTAVPDQAHHLVGGNLCHVARNGVRQGAKRVPEFERKGDVTFQIAVQESCKECIAGSKAVHYTELHLAALVDLILMEGDTRSEERRVGKECRS